MTVRTCSLIIGTAVLMACARDTHRVDTVVVVQAGAPTRAPAVADPIETIRSHYNRIERELPSYSLHKLDLTGMSTEGGALEVYASDNDVRKLTAMFYMESGRASEQFYFWDGKLIFVFRETERYDAPLSGRVAQREEDRFYFVRDSLVRWIGPDGRQRSVGTPEATAAVDELEATLRELRRQAGGHVE